MVRLIKIIKFKTSPRFYLPMSKLISVHIQDIAGIMALISVVKY